jgi:indolepyruvate ferredoxin oxidoreductase beta subunit
LEGKGVRTAETIGMAQRGGSVLGHVRITETTPTASTASAALTTSAPLSPLVPLGHASLLIGFEPGETVRALNYLQPQGTVVTARQALEPVTATLAELSYDGNAEVAYLQACATGGRIGSLAIVDGTMLCSQLGSTRVLNVILLGAALATGALGVSEAALQQAIKALVKPQYAALNEAALAQGAQHTG